jgi:hypothetical protein
VPFAHSSFYLLLLTVVLTVGCGGGAAVRQTKAEQPAAASRQSQSDMRTVGQPANEVQNSPGFAAAKRFLTSWGAGDIMRIAFERALNQARNEQPGMAELAQRVFADFKIEEFEDIAAGVYAKNLSEDRLNALARFSETKPGRHFFTAMTTAAVEGKSIDQTLMREFNADELTAILKFGESPEFHELQAKLPVINKELSEEGRRVGQKKMREYLQRQ